MRKLTEQNILNNTYWSGRYYEEIKQRIKKYEDDPHKVNRIESYGECKTCFYLKNDQFVTQAFTDYTCKNCDTVHTHHNGGVPKYCSQCSIDFCICVRCGGSLE